MKQVLLLTFLCLCLPAAPHVRAQASSQTILSLDSPRDQSGFIPLTDNWRYHPGDSMAWADPAFDDSDWEAGVATELSSQRGPQSGWSGIGWFRLHLEVAPELRNIPLALMHQQSGAAEIYLDGKRIHAVGQVAASREQEETIVQWDIVEPLLISFDNGAEHVVAVRFSNSWSETIHREGFPAGFEMSIGDWRTGVRHHVARTRSWTSNQMLFSGLAVAFALLHLLMFAFYPRIRANLYHALFTGSVAVFTYLAFELLFVSDPVRYLFLIQVLKVASLLFVIFGLRLLYDLFYPRPPVQFRLLTAGAVLISLGVLYIQIGLVYLYAILVLIEMFRVVLRAILKKQDGARIIGVGFLLFIVATVYQILMSVNILDELSGPFEIVYIYGVGSLLISTSVQLARNFARVNTNLEEYSRTLEAKVDERTTEVRAKNVQLEETLNELKGTQAQLIQSEKMASLGRLVAGVTHELNTPVGAIKSIEDTLGRAVTRLKEALGRALPLEDENSRAVHAALKVITDARQVVATGTDRVEGIVESLRNFARLDEAEFQVADLHEGIESTLTLLHAEIGDHVTIVKEYGDIGPIHCSPSQLNQAFMQVISNAAQSIQGSGEIGIRTFGDGDNIQVQITDTGAGIPSEQLEQIFEFGFGATGNRVKMKLGLSITYNIIQDHKGEIKIDSEVGQGTEVTITLPTGSVSA